MFKLAVIQNIIVPYEVPLYNVLAFDDDINLTVYFCSETYKHRHWNIPKRLEFNCETLPGFTLESGRLVSSVNPIILERLHKNKPDIILLSGGYVHLTMWLAFFYGKLLNIPIIYRSDEISVERVEHSLLAKIFSPFEKVLIKKSDAIICPGLKSKEYHLDQGGTLDRIFMVPYTTESDRLYHNLSKKYRTSRNLIKDDLGINEGKVVLYVGNLSDAKGVSYLLESFAMLSNEMDNIALVLLGNGPNINDYKRYCDVNDLSHVYFPGYKEKIEKIKYYSISDVFVFPSLRDRWGLVLNEAMLCGLPIITTRTVGAAEMVLPDHNGFIIGEANSADIYKYLKYILTQNEMRVKMGTESINIVLSKYTMKIRKDNFCKALKYVVSNRT